MSLKARHQRAMDVFDEVCDLPPGEQSAALARLCEGDSTLQREVEALLRHDATPMELLRHKGMGGGVEMLAADMASDVRKGPSPASATGESEVIPVQIGPYRILRKIGEGGMGVVYLAQQDRPQRTVALKVIRAALASPQTLRRFEHEAHVLGLLTHPGIAQIYQAGSAVPVMPDGTSSSGASQSFFAMEYIDGAPIIQYANERSLDVRQRLKLLMHVCRAVEYAHQKGVIHRDLKPSNILVADAIAQAHESPQLSFVHARPMPKILDFGVARLTDSDLQITTIQTDVGQLIGTLQYMSPEQVSADPGALDTRSDVYALGLILYELLTGQPPYDLRGTSVPEAMRMIREVEPARLSATNRMLRGDVETIARKALEKDKALRYQSAAELAEDLRRFLSDEAIFARPPSTMYRIRKFARRNRLLVGATAVVFITFMLGVIATVIGTTRGMIEARRQRDDALRQTAIAQAVNDFINNDLLGRADPTYEPDREIKLREVLDRAAATVSSRFQNEPLVQAAIHTTLGRTYMSLGENDKAGPHLEEALRLIQDDPDHDSAAVLRAETALAELLLVTSDYAGAESVCLRIIKNATELLGPSHDVTLVVQNIYANVLEKLNRYQEGESIAMQTYALRRERFGPAATETLSSMRLLGLLLERNGKSEQAESILAEAVQASVTHLGPEHPDTLSAMNNLALSYMGQQRWADAEQMFGRVFEVQKRVLGEKHDSTLGSMGSLALMQMAQGRYTDAEPIMVDRLRGLREAMGPTHSDTLNAQNSLAGLYVRTKRYDEAESLYEQTYQTSQATYGEKQLETLVARGGLMRVCIYSQRFEEARAIGEPTYAIMAEVLGESNPITQAMVNHMIMVAKGLKNDAEVAKWEAKLVKKAG